MDTEEFLIIAEEIAMQHPEAARAVRFLELCSGSIYNDRELITLAGEVVLKHAV